jgi:hypothetical protein
MNIATPEDYVIAAEQLFALFQSYIKAGFTRKEALELTKTILANARGK